MAVPLFTALFTVSVAPMPSTIVVMAPVTAMLIVTAPSIAPRAFIAMTLLPFTTLPIATAIVVSLAIPARANDNSGRGFNVHRWRRNVDRLGRIEDARDTNVDPNINVRECGSG